MATLTASSLSSFSSNVIVQPEVILVEATKVPTRDRIVVNCDGTKRIAHEDIEKYDKQGNLISFTVTVWVK